MIILDLTGKGDVMGLDIGIYGNLELHSQYYGPNSYRPDDVILLSNHDSFSHMNQDYKNNHFYKAEYIDGFGAGSYSSYNMWRKSLCINISGYEIKDVWDNKRSSIPCYELINFSDCEGWIPPTICEKLYDDISKLSYSDDLLEKFKRAFELAMLNNGVVIFH